MELSDLRAGFRARPPWFGGDLQTLRNYLVGPWAAPLLAGAERLDIPLGGGDGDILVAALNGPAVDRGRPTILLLHGLAGDQQSPYMRIAAARFLSRGHAVLRLNLRGAGPSGETCAGHYHAGRSDDLAQVLARLPADLTRPGIAAMGFSLGANILLKYLGEAGAGAPLMAACAVSAPADLAAASRALCRPRNLLYHRALLRDFKRHAARPGARLDAAERAAIHGAGTILQLDDRFVAPRHGFAGAADYYDRCRAGRYLAAIEVPTLILHAENDPIVPPAPEYRQPDRLAPAVTVALSRSGGHVGFHGRQGVWYLDRFTRLLDGLGA